MRQDARIQVRKRQKFRIQPWRRLESRAHRNFFTALRIFFRINFGIRKRIREFFSEKRGGFFSEKLRKENEEIRREKNSREIHLALKKIIENSQKILIKIHLKIHTKIRIEKNSPEKNSQELGTGIPDLASNLGIFFFSRILKNQSGLNLRARNLDWLARSNPGFQLPASGSQFPAPGSGLPASGFWLPKA